MAKEMKKIGHYRLEGILGTGGLGTVFRAVDERLGRPVALKVIRHDQMNRPQATERLQREARAVASLSHPYLVQLFDLVEWEEGLGLVMELIEGVTLANKLKDGPSGGGRGCASAC